MLAASDEVSVTLEPRSFKDTVGLFATGVTVITTGGVDGTAYGVTVSSFTSVSLDPPLILVCLDKQLGGLEQFLVGRPFVVNILGEDQETISNFFATSGTDRSWECGLYDKTAAGAPFLPNCLGWIECGLQTTHPGGDHAILVGEVETVRQGPDAAERSPLLYHRGRYNRLAKGFIPEQVTTPRTDL
jgi:3-hydroxy-9,10-secoandrosta-1,3,5(10)-triene-9,17-dione monooxygenase reductase component